MMAELPIRITHIITDLDRGGAETVLLRLLERVDRSEFDTDVVSLSTVGEVGRRISDLGIPVLGLGFHKPLYPVPTIKLVSHLRNRGSQVVQTWMYHADLLGGIAARLAGIDRVLWGIHTGPPPPGGGSLEMRVGLRVASWLSERVPARIVCCSHESKHIHAALGYAERKMLVIQNGFEIPEVPAGARQEIRAELDVDEDDFLVGRPGRYHPQKDYRTLLGALAILARSRPQARVVLTGTGITWRNGELAGVVRANGVADRAILLGPRDDLERINAACDLVVSSSSYGEGLPVTLGEAMAVGTPVITTDVGDSARLVDDADRVVPPGDVGALAKAMDRVLEMPFEQRLRLGASDRERVRDRFGVDRMATEYRNVYRQMAQVRDGD